MVEQFGELDVRNKKLGQVIATSPQLLLQKPDEFFEVGVTPFPLKRTDYMCHTGCSCLG